jgi:hypothetical protein
MHCCAVETLYWFQTKFTAVDSSPMTLNESQALSPNWLMQTTPQFVNILQNIKKSLHFYSLLFVSPIKKLTWIRFESGINYGSGP